jgi:dUTP pyrophosphatase
MATNVKTGLAYWAQPVDFARQPDSDMVKLMEVEGKLHRALLNSGWAVYNPRDAFETGGNPPEPFITRINQSALDQSGALVAFLPSNVITYGVPAEIEQFLVTGKPIVIVTDHVAKVSWTVAGWVEYPNVRVTLPGDSITELATWVVDTSARYEADRIDAHLSPTPLIFEASPEYPEVTLPTRGHDDDAGYDLYTVQDTVIPPGEFVDVPTGVAVDLPDGLWGMITGRSSTLRTRKLLVATGIIDNGYTGVLFAGCQNLSTEPVTVLAGERVAQLILLPTSALGFTAQWGQTRPKVRGLKGFGSTGR